MLGLFTIFPFGGRSVCYAPEARVQSARREMNGDKRKKKEGEKKKEIK